MKETPFEGYEILSGEPMKKVGTLCVPLDARTAKLVTSSPMNQELLRYFLDDFFPDADPTENQNAASEILYASHKQRGTSVATSYWANRKYGVYISVDRKKTSVDRDKILVAVFDISNTD